MVVILRGRPATRRQDIDRAKGLAILLVVFGHIVARSDPLNVNWYEPLRRAVYAFHMPFFLYLSGIVAVFSGALFTPPEKLANLVGGARPEAADSVFCAWRLDRFWKTSGPAVGFCRQSYRGAMARTVEPGLAHAR